MPQKILSYNNTLTVFVALLAIVSMVHAITLTAQKTDGTTKHTYGYYLGTFTSMPAAISFMTGLNVDASKKCYVATITSEQEWAFAQTVYNANQRKAFFMSGERDGKNVWKYNSGPEIGQTIYSQPSGQYSGFGAWRAGEPNNVEAKKLLTNNDDNPSWKGEVWYAGDCNYLIECSPINEPVLTQISTAGGPVTISNLANFKSATTVISVVGVGGSSFGCPKQGLGQGSTICQWPQGTGQYQITVSDGTITESVYYYRHTPPSISLVYAGTFPVTSGRSITIVGDSFGNVVADISVKFNGVTCQVTGIPVPHKTIICTLTANSVALMPITLKVGQSQTVTLTGQVAFYDPYNIRAISFNTYGASWSETLAFFSDQANTYLVDGQVGYMGVPMNQNQNTVIDGLSASTSPLHVPLIASTGQNVLITNAGGNPAAGAQVVTAGNCVSTLIACTGGFSGNKALNGGSTYSLTTNAFASRDEYTLAGLLTFYGRDPVFPDATKLIGTDGGALTIPVTGSIGFSLTSYLITYTTSGINVANSFTVNSTTMSFVLQMSHGTGAAKPTSFKFDQKTIYGPTIGYLPPSIVSLVGVGGGKATISGANFGYDNTKLTVKVGGQTLTASIINYHTDVEFSFGNLVGVNLPLQATVDGQVSNIYLFTPPPPQVSSATNTDTQLTISVANIGDGSTASVTLNGAALTIVSRSSSTLVCTLPITSLSGKIVVTAGGQPSTDFYYSLTPVLTSLSAPLPVEGGIFIVTGYFINDKRFNGTSTVFALNFATFGCPESGFSRDTSSMTLLTCNIGQGYGADIPVTITIDGVVSNAITFSFQPPVIYSVQSTNNIISIDGANFGTILPVISIAMAGQPAVVFTNLLSSGVLITATMPSTLLNDMVSVVVGGQSSVARSFIATPVISTADSAPVAGGLITIRGSYINALDASGLALTYSVKLNGAVCYSPLILDDKSLSCTAPAGVGANLECSLTLGTFIIHANIFSYIAPSISSVEFDSVTDTITITGLNFGSVPNALQVFFGASVSSVASSITSDNPQVAIAPIPASALNGYVSVTLASQQSNAPVFYVVPTITSISIPTTDGQTPITITGRHFTTVHQDTTPTELIVTLDGLIESCTSPRIDTLSTIICTPPAGTGINHKVFVTIDDHVSNIATFAYMVPHVDSATQNGTSLDIVGTNLGKVKEVVSVQFGALSNVSSTSVSETSMVVGLPATTKSGTATVFVDQQISNIFIFTLAPIPNSISTVPTTGGLITISGSFLNDQKMDGTLTPITVMFPGNSPCTGATTLTTGVNTNLTNIQCHAPAGSGKNLIVTVTIGGLSGTIDFSYGAPVLNSVTVNQDNSVVLTGTSFGNNPSLVVVSLGDAHPTFVLVNDQTITFTATPDMLNNFVSVSVDGRTSSKQMLTLFPILSSVTLSNTTGSEIIITGTFLNELTGQGQPTGISASVGSVTCTLVSLTNTQMVVIAPPGTGTGHTIIVTSADRSDELHTFGYVTPSITEIKSDAAADHLTIRGTNFGSNMAKLSLTPSLAVVSLVDDLLVVTLDTVLSKNGPLKVNVDGQTSNTMSFTIAPVISSSTKASPNGGTVEFSGRYLNPTRTDGSTTNISITVGDEATICTFTSATGSKLVCEIQAGAFESASIHMTIDGETSIGGTYTSISPVVVSSSSLYYLVGGNITITGTDFYQAFVMIDETSCINTVTTPTTIICYYDASVPTNDTLDITVYSEGRLESVFP
eukprot:gene19475-23328_t